MGSGVVYSADRSIRHPSTIRCGASVSIFFFFFPRTKIETWDLLAVLRCAGRSTTDVTGSRAAVPARRSEAGRALNMPRAACRPDRPICLLPLPVHAAHTCAPFVLLSPASGEADACRSSSGGFESDPPPSERAATVTAIMRREGASCLLAYMLRTDRPCQKGVEIQAWPSKSSR